MSNFCLKLGQVLKASATHFHPNFSEHRPGIKVLLDYQLSPIKKFYGEKGVICKRSQMPRNSFATCYLSLINSRKKTNILRSTGTRSLK